MGTWGSTAAVHGRLANAVGNTFSNVENTISSKSAALCESHIQLSQGLMLSHRAGVHKLRITLLDVKPKCVCCVIFRVGKMMITISMTVMISKLLFGDRSGGLSFPVKCQLRE